MEKYVKYTHVASMGYNPDARYKLEDVLKTEGEERVRAFFTPIDFKWEEEKATEKKK